MKITLVACALGLLGVAYSGAALADDMAPSSPKIKAEAAQNGGISAGQSIYNTQGTKLGVVQDVTVDANGQQQAVVDLGSRNIRIAAADLQTRSGGGLVTNLSDEEIAKTPAAQ